MARQVSNVDIIQDTFENWLLLTNELLNSLSTEIITANTTYSNTGNSSVQRNAQLFGNFGANTIVITNELRGGNINSGYATLAITSNVSISSATATFTISNTSSLSYITPIGSYFGNGTSNSSLTSTAIILQTSATVNTNISASQFQLSNSTNTATITPISFVTGLFTGNTTAVSVGANVVVNSTSIYVGNSTVNSVFTQSQLQISNSSSVLTLNPTSIITGNSTVNNQSNSTQIIIQGTTAKLSGNTTQLFVGNSTVNTVVSTTQLAISNSSASIQVGPNSITSSSLQINGNTTFVGNVSIGSTGDYLTQVVVNNDIGSSTSANLVVYTFPKASFSSAKVIVQIKATGNTQISEAVLAHDGTDSYITTYATVSAPASSNSGSSLLGTLGANINGTNCELLVKQNIANSQVKIIAHLIK